MPKLRRDTKRKEMALRSPLIRVDKKERKKKIETQRENISKSYAMLALHHLKIAEKHISPFRRNNADFVQYGLLFPTLLLVQLKFVG